MAERPPDSADAAVLAATVDRLRTEIDGLHAAMRTRGVIEQAKGVLMERLACSADEAFAHLARQSQDRNRKVVEIAAELVGADLPADLGRGTPRRGPAPPERPDGDGWFQDLLDGLLNPAVVLSPVPAAGTGEVVDFCVDHANAATVDLAGRTGADLVGRRMTDLYPGMVVSGVFRRLLDVQRTGIAYQGTAEQFIEVVGGALHSSTMVLRAVRFRDGLLLNWHLQDDDERRSAQLAQAQRLARLGTWEYDADSGELTCSPEVFRIVGLDGLDAAPDVDDIARLIEPDDLPDVLRLLRLLRSEHRTQTVEFRIRRPDGRPCAVRAAAEVVATPDGGLVTIRGVLQDVSVWRHAQAALAEARGQLVEERERSALEHHAVRMLQRALLAVPDRSDPQAMRFAARYVPAETGTHVGGDWYDAATLPDGRTLVAIGDVSGHGLPAAAAMTQLRHALRGMAYSGAAPARILRWLNEMVCHQRSDYIATAICGHFDPDAGTLTWAQAGHPPPLRVRGGVPRVLEPPVGMVLGATPEADYGTGVLALEPGDMVLMYTDGLVERSRGDLARGMSQLVRTVRDQAPDDLQECVAGIMRRHGGPNPRDDTCLIGFQIPAAP